MNYTDKTLIFTVCTGRCGTGYLSNQLENYEGVAAYHEPAPKFQTYLRTLYSIKGLERKIAKEFWLNNKFPFINSQQSNIYIEISHLACKGFLEGLFELDIYPYLIAIKRNNREVAKSMYSLNHIPGRNTIGISFYLHPEDSHVLPVTDWKSLTDYQLCYWYTLEIDRRIKMYKRNYKEMPDRILDLSFQQIIAEEAVDLISDKWKIEFREKTPSIKERIKKIIKPASQKINRTNSKSGLKHRNTKDIDFEKEEEELLNRLKKHTHA